MSKVARSRIAAVIAQRSLEEISAHQLAHESAAYLLYGHRTGELESLLRDIMEYRAQKGIIEVSTTSAHPLTTETGDIVKAWARTIYPDAKQIIVSEQVDSNLIGSIRLELANQQLDASVRTKLNYFKQLTLAGKDI